MARVGHAVKLFGTDGVRGLANVEPMTPETVLRLGQALAHRVRLIRQPGDAVRCRIVIGRDTRRSGDLLESALVAGICSRGGDALLAGVVPTPAVAFLTRHLQADAGVVVSASHNPFHDNGIKIFGPDGFKLPDADEVEIEALVLGGGLTDVRPTGKDVGTAQQLDDAGKQYVDCLRAAFGEGRRLEPLKIVLDCANGAAVNVGPQLFRALGCDTILLGVSPDGVNINHGCGATNPRALQDEVVAQRAQLGIALDGDADRVILVDETGAVVDGDEILAILANDLMARGALKGSTVVATVMSNLGLELALRERGAQLLRTPVGDRYVVEAMRRHGHNLGGEQSGHVILLDYGTTGDGLLAGLCVARLMMEHRQPLSVLRGAMQRLPQAMVNVRVKARRELNELAAVQDCIEEVETTLNDRGRVLVRYSGTEPLVRVMVEGDDAAHVDAAAQRIADVIRTHLG